MLQQILKDMFIDPDVLDALNEDQKKTLFVKMRQEQVRRWTEREEKLEREVVDGECKRTTPKKANSKNVSWLLGRDGDVAVVVIGELDELNSKFIHSGFGEKKAQSLQNNACDQTILKSRTTEPVKAERENTQPGISLNLKGKREETSPALPLPVSVSEHSSPTAAEKPESKSASATEEESASWRPISTRLLRTPNPVDARPPPSANPAPASVNPRLCLANLRTATAAPTPSPRGTAKTDSAAAGGGPHSQGPQKSPAHHSGKDVAASEVPRRAVQAGAGSSLSSSSGGGAPTCAGRGRVAQLMKTFSTESAAAQTQPVAAPRGVKPPLPNKPGHLRLKTTPTVR